MNLLRAVTCLSTLALVAACAPAGYYDSQGYYHAYDAGTNTQVTQAAPAANTTIIEHDRPASYTAPETRYNTASDDMAFSREGFYDKNGYFIAMENGPAVPGTLIPPRGMCRVWFSDRQPDYQPPVESCNGISARLPAGAYVLYGG